MAAVPGIPLNNGLIMPGFGLGTFESFTETIAAVKAAIDAGYRHFDTAFLYGTESAVGEAVRAKIAEGVVRREDLFIVTKLWNTHHEPEKVEAACRRSNDNLGLEYIDLYLMHYPTGFVERDPFEWWPKKADGQHDHTDVDYVDTWRAMERLVDIGLVRSIGISNFNSEQITRLLAHCRIRPVNNQIEVSPQITQKPLTRFCRKHDIVVTAYCPLGRPQPTIELPRFLYSEALHAIAKRHGKTPAQVVFRYLLDLGTVPIPKSVRAERIAENIAVFDFQLSDAERADLDAFETGERVIDFEESRGHKYFPFSSRF